jgi:hypothetical protein
MCRPNQQLVHGEVDLQRPRSRSGLHFVRHSFLNSNGIIVFTHKSAHSRSSFTLLQVIVNPDQVLNAKESSTSSRKYKRVGSRKIGPLGWQKPHSAVLVSVIHALLAPFAPLREQTQSSPTQRMKRMGYAESCTRIARLRCICLRSPCRPPESTPFRSTTF